MNIAGKPTRRSGNVVFKLAVTAGVIAVISAPPISLAEQVYKVTARDGTVSYSNAAPESSLDAELISIHPEPSIADIQEAKRQLQRLRQDLASRTERRTAENSINAVEPSEEKKPPPPLVFNPFIGIAPFVSPNQPSSDSEE